MEMLVDAERRIGCFVIALCQFLRLNIFYKTQL